MIRAIPTFIFLFTVMITQAQKVNKITLGKSYNTMDLVVMFDHVEETYGVNIICDRAQMEAFTIFGIRKDYKLLEFLDVFLVGFTAIKIHDKVIFIIDNKHFNVMKYLKHNYVIIKNDHDDIINFEGIIFDDESDEPIFGANIYFPELNKGVVSDQNGKYSISIPRNIHYVEIQYVGYQTKKFMLGFSPFGKETSLKSVLFEASTLLAGVEISAKKQDRNVSQQLTGIEKLGIESIKALPTFMGEVDPLKSLSTLPGVSTTGDLAAGINVRGGDTGQNLIYQDGAIIYNPTHLFGFFSAFNSDMIKDVTLYKGGGASNYGGRVSSVLDISLKNGNTNKHIVKGGIGMLSSRLSAEGPILNQNSSYHLGGRISYSDWLIKSVDNIQLKNSSANFYDLTGKLFHKIDKKNFVTLSGYYSYDDFNLATDSTYSWGTKNISLRWDHNYSEHVFSTFRIANSNYGSQILNKDEISNSIYENGINDFSVKYDLSLNQTKKNRYLVGVQTSYTRIDPGTQRPVSELSITGQVNLLKQKMLEPSLYAHGDFEIGSKLALSSGIRISAFLRFGEDISYTYNKNVTDGRIPLITDSTYYAQGELMATDIGLEPRLSLRYLITPNTSLKTSFYRTRQYMHLVSNTTMPTPQDYWLASSDKLKPQVGDQVSLGLFRNFGGDKYEMSLEGYYKTVQNTVDYIEGADVSLNQAIETSLVQGKGKAYGLEYLLRKNNGTINGWIAYTYSRSLRQFESDNPDMKINNGAYYPSIYDQPHNLSVVLNYLFSERVILSSTFQYSSGRPITIPTSKYSYASYLSILNYSNRNEYRMPDYHRLDVSLTVKDRNYEDRFITGEWIFSIYNVYAHKNVYSIFFNRTGLAYKLSILGSVFPSISYNFKF